MVSADMRQTLRDWYIATLRKSAMDLSAKKVTPGTLIQVDKQMIESMVLDATRTQPLSVAGKSTGTQGKWLLVMLPIVLLVIVAAAIPSSASQLGVEKLIIIGGTIVLSAYAARACTRLDQNNDLQLYIHSILGQQSESSSGDSKSHTASVASNEKILAELDQMVRERSELKSGLDLIADMTPSSLWCFDQNLMIKSVNFTAASELGFEVYELESSGFLKLVAASQVARVSECISGGNRLNEPIEFECQMAGRHGRFVDFRFYLEWSESNQCFFAIGENVTSAKNLQRAKEDFVAMIGHDIRTPLGSVLMSLQSLDEGIYGQISSEARTAVRNTEKTTVRLIALLAELLEYESAAAGTLDLDKTHLDLTVLVRDALNEFTEPLKRLQVRLDLPKEPQQVNVDRSKLLRVLVNLLSNAIKYAPVGEEFLVQVVPGRGSVEVRITDKGRGIALDQQPLIFERYMRVQDEANRKISGTGLGLPIAKAIVECHGGMIGVESEKGKGSTFWFTLPTVMNVTAQ